MMLISRSAATAVVTHSLGNEHQPPAEVDVLCRSCQERIAPLLPTHSSLRRRFPGCKPVDDRAALVGTVFVLKTSITFSRPPARVIGRCAVICRRRGWIQ